jgi:hypothetical protein
MRFDIFGHTLGTQGQQLRPVYQQFLCRYGVFEDGSAAEL